MRVFLQTTGLLLLSNVFMTFARYAHLKDLNQKPWIVAVFLRASLCMCGAAYSIFRT